jgi:DNA-binding beta-propeller fold protein YncE
MRRKLIWPAVLLAASALCQTLTVPGLPKGDGGPATKAEINAPDLIAVDPHGNLYIYEQEGEAVRRIDAVSQTISTVALGCRPFWKKPVRTDCLGPVSDLLVDSDGTLLFAEFAYNRLSRLDLHSGTLSVFAGNGGLTSSGDGGPVAMAGITAPYCIAIDSKSNILVCDSSYRIRRISPSGLISTVAGTGRRGLAGDRGPAIQAELDMPVSIAVDGSDNIYFADDTSNRIRKIDAATGIVQTVGGSGPITEGMFSLVEFSGEGGLATRARFSSPRSLTFDRDGDLLFVASGRVCRIDKEGYLRTIAGTGQDGYSGDGGPATKALIGPVALAVDSGGNIFIADYENNRIRRIDAKSGIITTVGGNGLPVRPPPVIM